MIIRVECFLGLVYDLVRRVCMIIGEGVYSRRKKHVEDFPKRHFYAYDVLLQYITKSVHMNKAPHLPLLASTAFLAAWALALADSSTFFTASKMLRSPNCSSIKSWLSIALLLFSFSLSI